VNPQIVREAQVRNPAAKPSMFDVADPNGEAAPGSDPDAEPTVTPPAGADEATASEEEMDAEAEDFIEPYIELRKFDFVVQFAWAVTPPMKRAEIKAEKAAAAEAAAAEAAAEAEAAADTEAEDTAADAAPASPDESTSTPADAATATPAAATPADDTGTPAPAPAPAPAPDDDTGATPPAAATPAE
jgi:hypothetical protein